MGVGFGASGPLCPAACKNARKSSGVATGNALAEILTMSVLLPSGSLNRIAIPCGLALGSASGSVGMPVVSENRTNTGTLFAKWGALLKVAAEGLGVNVPSTITPFA